MSLSTFEVWVRTDNIVATRRIASEDALALTRGGRVSVTVLLTQACFCHATYMYMLNLFKTI
jgi:hypothetical protein